MSKQAITVLLCGILSGSAFLLAVYSPQAQLLPLFLPILPLAFIGLSVSFRHSLAAAAIAAFIVLVATDSGTVLFMAAMLLIPACHFIRKALLWRGGDAETEWYPVLEILSDLTLMAAGIFMLAVLTINYPEHSDLKTLVSQSILSQLGSQIDTKDPNMAHFMKLIMSDWVFMIFALTGWLWVMMIYGMTLLVNMFLNSQHMALRPSLALTPQGIPAWLPAVVLAGMALAFLGKGNDHFAGETVFLILMLPYFLSGLVSLHNTSRSWRNRRFWLGMIYIGFLFFPWAMVLFIAKGVHTQMGSLLKRFGD
ncbi:MAG TPA: hypothetical protein VFT64_04745 [Rickettsiales bacterium]|nr:hypothetical protein [Rickettsiales bacterium]